MGKAKNQTIGYKYYMGIHMGVGRGPIDEMCEIQVGDRQAWLGSVTENQNITINKPDLFGGTKSEGGIDGTLDVMMGGDDQIASPRLHAMLAGPQPQFRGVVTAFFDGMVCAMNPYPKTWKFRIRRALKGWDGPVWYPEKCVIEMDGYDAEGNTQLIRAMNPAHIIYEAITNRKWGLGRDRSLILEESMRAAADTLYDEGLGLCLRWSRQDTLMSFVQTIIDHVSGAIYVDKFTGRYRFKLIRSDYDADSLPIFDTDSGLLSIDEATNASPFNLTNEIVATFHNPITDEDGQARAHNLALIQTQGSLNSDTRDYPGIPTAKLAAWVAKRDLKVASTNIRRFTITCDRRAWRVQPGDVIKIRDPQSRGIETVIIRVGSTEEAGQEDGKIKIVGVQDMFGVDLNTFGQVQPPTHVEPDFSPAIARRLIYEYTYAELSRMMPDGEFSAMQASEGYIHAHAEKPTPVSMAFDLMVQPEGGASFVTNGNGDFTALGELATAVGYLDTEITIAPSKLSSDFDWNSLEAGMGIAIQTLEGEAVEMLRLEGWDSVTGKLTVGRGVMDTIPHRHFGGEPVWITHDEGGSDWTKYLSGETVNMKIIPWTMRGGRFPEDEAPVDTLTFAHRFIRPYPPGNLTVTTIAAGEAKWFTGFDLRADAGTDEVPDFGTFKWAHRDRVIQTDVLVSHPEGDIGPEPGQTYRLRVFNATGQLVREETGIGGTQFSYTYGMAAEDTRVEDGSPEFAEGTIFFDSQRDGYDSWQAYRIPFTVHKKPPQRANIAEYTLASIDDPAAGDAGYDNSDQGGVVAMQAQQVAQQTDGSDGEDNQNINVALMSAQATQDTKLTAPVDFYLYEYPYLSLLREGRDTDHSQLMAFVARPADRLTDGFDLYDRVTGSTDWNGNGAQSWTPWGQLTGYVDYLTNEITLGDTSDADGVPVASAQSGDILLVDNELMMVNSVDGKVIKVGRGSADTVPAPHYAKALVWLFDREHAAGGLLYGDEDAAQASVVPHTHSAALTTADVAHKQLQMQTRPRRPYPPGLLLANGNHWFDRVDARAVDFDWSAPQGRDSVFSWAHRNRVSQGSTAVDHFASGIKPEAGTDYRIWIGYTVSNVNSSRTVTLLETYTADSGWVLSKADAETLGERAGRALSAGGNVQVQMAINARRDGLYNWQGYTLSLLLPSYPLSAGEEPGGGTVVDPPKRPNPGDPTPNPSNPNPESPGDGNGDLDPTPDPELPNPNPDPEVPGTEPPPPEPEPEPDPENVYGWSINWDHGWAEDLPNQTASED